MRVNGIKNQSFGMNPSDIIRKGLAGEIVKGRNLDEFMGLIKEIYPYRFMTALNDGDKFFWVGATRRFERKPQMITYIKTENGEKVLDPVRKEDYGSATSYNYYKKYRDSLLEKYPSRTEIMDKGEDFITLFKSVKGKLFSDIVEPITKKLKAIKEAYSPSERACLKIANIFPEYRDIPDANRVRSMAKDTAQDVNWMNMPIG